MQNLWKNDMFSLDIVSKTVLWSESWVYVLWNVAVIQGFA